MERTMQNRYRQKIIPQEQFVDQRLDFTIVDIQLNPPHSPNLRTWKTSSTTLLKEALDSIDEQTNAPSFRLVEVIRDSSNRNYIDHISFHDLLTGFHISNETHVLIQYNVLGFHCFQHHNSVSGEYTCYINDVPYMLLWSVNPTKIYTRAILLCSNKAIHSNFAQFRNALDMNKHLIGEPSFLPVTSALLTVHNVHRHINKQRMEVRKIEVKFGFSTWNYPELTIGSIDGVDVSQLTGYTKLIASSLVAIGDMKRRLKLTELLLKSVEDKECGPMKRKNGSSEVRLLQETRQQLALQIQCAQIQNDYLENRAKNQFTVLFNLINQRDATTNINLAAQAKEDSSAMKTIAVMTMAFLPGTFFAALFAVPSLQWTGDKVVTGRFWVYWAFTIPVTLVIFAIWVGITVQQKVIGYVQEVWKKSLPKNGDNAF
ncbi:hypothetical protein VE00_09866 [Pseudogymnoascus sp. WSF 3629]|nr:hypothetical protein VE00_09866 [Pseudogymnoascus sp. WSF 3629]